MPVTDLGALLQDAQSLVFGHEVAATGIRRQALDLPSKSGMLYALEGPVATLQFFVTDSVDHFHAGFALLQPQAQPRQCGACAPAARSGRSHHDGNHAMAMSTWILEVGNSRAKWAKFSPEASPQDDPLSVNACPLAEPCLTTHAGGWRTSPLETTW